MATYHQAIAGVVLAVLFFSNGQATTCWDAASAKYNIHRDLLIAIAQQESRFNNRAVTWNRNGSRDVCMMQINSSWFPVLEKRFGISEARLHQDPCTCLDVGAWILHENFHRLGVTWDAVGAYNAMSPTKRTAYAQQIHRRLRALTPADATARY